MKQKWGVLATIAIVLLVLGYNLMRGKMFLAERIFTTFGMIMRVELLRQVMCVIRA
jgi:hypothetical protein